MKTVHKYKTQFNQLLVVRRTLSGLDSVQRINEKGEHTLVHVCGRRSMASRAMFVYDCTYNSAINTLTKAGDHRPVTVFNDGLVLLHQYHIHTTIFFFVCLLHIPIPIENGCNFFHLYSCFAAMLLRRWILCFSFYCLITCDFRNENKMSNWRLKLKFSECRLVLSGVSLNKNNIYFSTVFALGCDCPSDKFLFRFNEYDCVKIIHIMLSIFEDTTKRVHFFSPTIWFIQNENKIGKKKNIKYNYMLFGFFACFFFFCYCRCCLFFFFLYFMYFMYQYLAQLWSSLCLTECICISTQEKRPILKKSFLLKIVEEKYVCNGLMEMLCMCKSHS